MSKSATPTTPFTVYAFKMVNGDEFVARVNGAIYEDQDTNSGGIIGFNVSTPLKLNYDINGTPTNLVPYTVFNPLVSFDVYVATLLLDPYVPLPTLLNDYANIYRSLHQNAKDLEQPKIEV